MTARNLTRYKLTRPAAEGVTAAYYPSAEGFAAMAYRAGERTLEKHLGGAQGIAEALEAVGSFTVHDSVRLWNAWEAQWAGLEAVPSGVRDRARLAFLDSFWNAAVVAITAGEVEG